MALSKLEIQQMLREMNVKFHADATYDQLKQRLQQANHSLWLKSVSAEQASPERKETPRIRRRKRMPPSAEPMEPSTAAVDPTAAPRKPEPRMAAPPSRRPTSGWRPRPIETPAPGKPWKKAADGTEPFNRKKKVFASVLKRSGRCCECCGVSPDGSADISGLEPFHILPLDQGGEHSIKNVVALCTKCLETLQSNPDTKVLKELKRKTRSRLYDALQVVKKKKGRGRKENHRRRR